MIVVSSLVVTNFLLRYILFFFVQTQLHAGDNLILHIDMSGSYDTFQLYLPETLLYTVKNNVRTSLTFLHDLDPR